MKLQKELQTNNNLNKLLLDNNSNLMLIITLFSKMISGQSKKNKPKPNCKKLFLKKLKISNNYKNFFKSQKRKINFLPTLKILSSIQSPKSKNTQKPNLNKTMMKILTIQVNKIK
jgi:hypothetical protein